MIVKNQLLALHCERLGAEMEGVCFYEGQTVFVPGALPGEDIETRATLVKKRYAFARLEHIVSPSAERVEPPCPHYRLCGGCAAQHMTYALTLAQKRAQIEDCLTRIGGFSLPQGFVPPVLGAESPYHSRNKTSLPVAGTWDAPQIGFYRRRSHQVVPISDCPIAMPGLPPILGCVADWMRQAHVDPYCEETGKGLLRHVVVRRARSGDALVLLAATSEHLPDAPYLWQLLTQRASGVRGLHVTLNRRRDNVILGDTSRRLFGEETITETLLGLDFEIAPLSFFQVNPAQTERLYQQALDFAELRPGDICVDAYAGAGTIALCMARSAARVIGIEIVPQAIEAARRNAERNGLRNADFLVGAVEQELPRLVAEGLRPDVVVLDPPRKGIEPPVIKAVLAAKPRRVVYVSCHVPSQARDLALLRDGGYRLTRCQGVDLFCYADGVENVALLERA